MVASPLMTGYFGGTDLSFEAGIAVAALVYYGLARAVGGKSAYLDLRPKETP
jgi:hypothetical protein